MKKQFLSIIILILLVGTVYGLENLTLIQTLKANVLPGELKIYSPLNNYIYNNRMILLNLTYWINADSFKYIDDKNLLINLCSNCGSYGYNKLKQKPFDDGFHELTFLAVFSSGTIHQKVNFIVDTKKPVILNTNPKANFAYGDFEVEFEEANPKTLFLHYGNEEIGYRIYKLNLSDECYSYNKNRKKCESDVDLSDYDQQEITYFFKLNDISDKYTQSKFKTLDVDFSSPMIDNPDSFWKIKENYIYFNISITEPHFNKIEYMDLNDKNPKYISLCISLKNKICKIRKSFKKGEHDLFIRISDKAGNYNIKEISFVILE